ncbi:MAG: Hsp20/alpha crystallin family protein [Candidatus Sericytochromatia bacterium]|nr:Hsp20/alpha crystallin family protein [Candidatus Tanganyikabacteria bacterium]
MALMRWEPLQELDRMRREMERMFDRVAPRITFAPLPTRTAPMFMPDVDVCVTDKEVLIKANLPGIEPDKVNVEVTRDRLNLSGRMERAEEVEEEGYFVSERQYGEFSRSIDLPEFIKEDQAKATFKDGVLTIRAPRLEEGRPERGRKIPIEAQK